MKKNGKIIGIIVLVIVAVVLFVCCIGWFYDTILFPKKDEYKITYQIDDINNMYDGTLTKYSSNEISENNLKGFNILLKYIDKEIGKNNYELESLYEVNLGEIDKRYQDKISSYVIKVIPKMYKEKFIEYGKDKSDNPYLVMYKINPDYIMDKNKIDEDDYYDTFVESGYPSLVVGLKYEEQIKQYFLNKYPSYKVRVYYNPYFSGLQAASVNSKPDIDVYSSYYEPTAMDLFVPYGNDIEKIKNELINSKEELKEMGIKNISVCLLKENVNINNLDLIRTSQFSDEIDKTLEIYTVK